MEETGGSDGKDMRSAETHPTAALLLFLTHVLRKGLPLHGTFGASQCCVVWSAVMS